MNMKITISELRQVIRDVIKECYGWPVESEKSLYDAKSNMGSPSPHDPKNSALRFPRGSNTRNSLAKSGTAAKMVSKAVREGVRGGLNESFSKITAKELNQWQAGNWGYIHEESKADDPDVEECSECGGMKDSHTNECDCG